MPSLISPDKAGTLTQDQRANLENELREEASKLSHDLAVGDNSSEASKRDTFDKTSLDADLHAGPDIFGQMTERALAETKAYLMATGVPENKIDRALRLDNHAIPPRPTDPAIVDLHRQAGVPLDPKAQDYIGVDFGKLALDLPAERLGHVAHVTRQFAADLKLDPAMGKAVTEYLVEQGNALAKMNSDEFSRWNDAQSSQILKAVGGNRAKASELREKAVKVLRMSGEIAGPNGTDKFSEAVINSRIMNSAWLQLSLANHADQLERVERAKAKLK